MGFERLELLVADHSIAVCVSGGRRLGGGETDNVSEQDGEAEEAEGDAARAVGQDMQIGANGGERELGGE